MSGPPLQQVAFNQRRLLSSDDMGAANGISSLGGVRERTVKIVRNDGAFIGSSAGPCVVEMSDDRYMSLSPWGKEGWAWQGIG
jgi:hypothetical protein